jgi:hypothetical protein
MIEEKRAYPRKKVSLATNILESKTEKVLGDCILTDISKNGFAVESEINLHVGQQFDLELEVLNRKIILNGEVIRSADGLFYPLYGVKIIDNESKNLDFFRQYIDLRMYYENN